MNHIASVDSALSRRQLFRYGGLTALVGATTVAPSLFGLQPGIASAAPVPTYLSSAAVVANGMWSWWIYPLAVNDRNLTWVGSIDNKGVVSVSRFSTKSNARVVLGQSPSIDDHNGPAIAFNSDQVDVIAFWAGHNQKKYVEYRRINRSTMVLGPSSKLTFSNTVSYAQVVSHGNRLVLFTRCPQGRWAFRSSENFGATWGPEGTFLQEDVNPATKQYISLRPHATVPGKFLFTAYTHPTSGTYRSIDAGLLDLTDGNVTDMVGNSFGNLFALRARTSADLTFSAGQKGPQFRLGQLGAVQTPPPGHRIRLLDTGFVNDKPAVAYAIWPDNNYVAGQYGIALHGDGWQPTGWALASGAGIQGTDAIRHYFGGIGLGHNDGTFYTTRQIDDSGQWIAEKWLMSPDGAAAEAAIELASSAETQLFRPIVPAGTGQTAILALNVHDYTSFTKFNSDVVRLYTRPAAMTASQVDLVASDSVQGYGQTPVTVTATVQMDDGGYPEGSIRFTSGTAVIATVPLANSQASYTLKSTASPGVKTLKAWFVPIDAAEQLPSQSAPIAVTVVKPVATTVKLTSSAAVQVVGGSSVTVTAVVRTAKQAAGVGSVQFLVNGKKVATTTLVSGKAGYTLKASASPGAKSFTAVFLPADVKAQSTSTAAATQVTVVKPTASKTVLSVSKSRQVIGTTPAVVTAVVTLANKAKPVGTVKFRANGVVVSSAKVVNGKATFTLKSTSTPKTRTFTASFVPTGPSALHSTSNTRTVTVVR